MNSGLIYSTFATMKMVPHVLVAPLEWGLGHATRCIPVIRELLTQNCTVTICATGACKILLQKEFPGIKLIEIPGIIIHYPKNGQMALSVLSQAPSILKAIRNEHAALKNAIAENQFTHIISDNRYGFYSPKVKTAFISHQLKIKGGNLFSFLEPILFQIHKMYLERFDELWIPDFPSPNNISGSLSDPRGLKIPVNYLGILSRFSNPVKGLEKKYEKIALLSGPEPQRTLLEAKVKSWFLSLNEKCLIIQGLPAKTESEVVNNVEIVPSISTTGLFNILHPDTLLISRSGYSTIMDMAAVNHKNLLFIPTPGQTEQEYLAKYLNDQFGYNFIQQHENFPSNSFTAGKDLLKNSPTSTLAFTIKKFLAS